MSTDGHTTTLSSFPTSPKITNKESIAWLLIEPRALITCLNDGKHIKQVLNSI